MAGPIRVGIVGANPTRGWALSAHLPALSALPDYEVTAVSTTRAESAAETAAKFGIPHSFDNAKALAEHDDVDLVVISVKVPHHLELTRTALDAGKHVFTEWPLGASSEQAAELTTLAKARGVHHIIGLQGRHGPLNNYVRHLVSEGYVGRVLSVTLQIVSGQWGGPTIAPDRAWTADRANGANLLTITGGHTLDTLRYALGEFAEVNGIVTTLHPTATIAGTEETVNITVPDNVALNGRLSTGAVATITFLSSPSLSSAPSLAGTYWQVLGEEGSLTITGAGLPHYADAGLTLRGHTGSGPVEELTVPASFHRAPAEVPEGPAQNVAALYASVADAIAGGTPIEPNFETALSLHHLLDDVQASSDEGERRRPA
ncbi:MAG: Gfo/Idh/MocA family oxidoreductase [Acidimicrobiaceae bacterium]|nr:Gfo/Idh/MocA family oxidoreductase [Acidimicrobiaceae bacterium]